MLVLSRKPNEVVRIGDNVSVSVVSVRGDRVRLGIDAPKSVPVHRAEVAAAIDRQAKRSTKPTASPVSVWLATVAESIEPHAFGFLLHASTFTEAIDKAQAFAGSLGFTPEGVARLTLDRCGALDDPATVNTTNAFMRDARLQGVEFIQVPGAVA